MADDWLSLTHALTQTMRSHAPGWTDGNDSDPGITMLELIAYLARSLRLHGTPSEDLSSAAAHAIGMLEAIADREPVAVFVNGERWQRLDLLADAGPNGAVFTLDQSTGEITVGDGVHGRVPESGAIVTVRYRERMNGADGNTWITVRTTWPPPHRRFSVSLRQSAPAQPFTGANATERWSRTTRPNYFSGKVLGVEDFREEQQYHVGKHRRHLQTLHGSGVARGLDVSASSDGTSITVAPGLALDASGHEIVLDEPVLITPPPDAISPAWVVLEYAERAIDVMPTLNDEPQASRIQEGCRIMISASPSDTGVTLARVLNEANDWRVDQTFVPARPR